MSKPYAIYITRWLDRPAHTRYLKTLEQIRKGEWWNDNFDIYVAAHGWGHQGGKPDIWENWLDFYDKDGSNFGRLARKCFLHAMASGYEMIGFLDDDAYCREPQDLMNYGMAVRETLNPGAHGPFGHYRYMAQYKCYLPDPVLEMDRNERLSTYGMQFHCGKLVREIWPVLDKVLPNIYILDEPFFRIARAFDRKLVEYYIPGFMHTTSYGVGKAYDKQWFYKKLRSNLNDVVQWEAAGQYLGISPQVMLDFSKNIHRTLKTDVERAVKFNSEEELEKWEIHPNMVKDWESLEAANVLLENLSGN